MILLLCVLSEALHVYITYLSFTDLGRRIHLFEFFIPICHGLEEIGSSILAFRMGGGVLHFPDPTHNEEGVWLLEGQKEKKVSVHWILLLWLLKKYILFLYLH